MPRHPYGGKRTVGSCRSIEVLHWNRRGYFKSPRRFSWTWSRDGQRTASINVQTQRDVVTLRYRNCAHGDDWIDVKQPIAIAWTPCRFGGERPWFICSVRSNGAFCGRKVTKLYAGGPLFACRHCYVLTYASQQEPLRERGLFKSQKIRMDLGGSPNMLEEFPDKPKGMHWRTYDRIRGTHDRARNQSMIGLMRSADRMKSRPSHSGRR
jgi:hypothetical protein